jgi:type IV secretory pathway VirB2 component (pilin)
MEIVKKVKEVAGYYKAKYNLDSSSVGATLGFMLLALVVLAPDSANAAAPAATVNAEGMGQVVCNIIKQLQGPVARGVAAFGIIFLGFSLFLGKISWGVALALGIGVAAIFGAESIVDAMLGDAGTACTSSSVVS